ncbi:MAG: hypothetical protein HZA53_06730 [Planctomycetes bacterium]|nr:hypothetical protein [Planctomycetota bacterium]
MRTRARFLGVAAAGSVLALLVLWFALRAPETAPKASVAAGTATEGVTSARTSAPSATAIEEERAPQGEERVARTPEVRGRLIDATTGLPLAGRTIELRARKRPSVDARLGDAGRLAQLLQGRLATGSSDPAVVFTGLPGPDGTDSVEQRRETAVKLTRFMHEVRVRHDALRAANEPAPPRQSETEPGVEVSAVGVVSAAPGQESVAPPFDVEVAQGEFLAARVHIAALGQLRANVGDGEALVVQRSHVAQDLSRLLIQQSIERGQFLTASELVLQDAAGTSFSISGFDGGRPTLAWPVGTRLPPPLRTLATTNTDDQGRFRFDCPEELDVELEFVPRDDDWVEDATWTFPEAGSACRDAIEWRLDLAPGSRVTGRVLDARTQAPVPELTLELRGARDWVESLTTDDDGRFASSTIFPAGPIEWTVHDGSEERRIAVEPRDGKVERARAGAPELVLLAAMGPTWRFRFSQAQVEQALGKPVRTLQEHDGGGVEVRLVGAEPWPGWEGSGNPFAEWQPVHREEDERPAFVRYPVAPKLPRGGAWAEFRSSDGAWCGAARLTDSPEAHDVELHESARVEVIVQLPEDAASSAWSVRATRAAGVGLAGAYATTPCDAADGLAVLEHLDPECVRALELLRDGVVVRTLALELEPGGGITVGL